MSHVTLMGGAMSYVTLVGGVHESCDIYNTASDGKLGGGLGLRQVQAMLLPVLPIVPSPPSFPHPLLPHVLTLSSLSSLISSPSPPSCPPQPHRLWLLLGHGHHLCSQ